MKETPLFSKVPRKFCAHFFYGFAGSQWVIALK
jgi:hypothetical protein